MTRERPIIFTADSVNGILAGRKFQTRRLMKSQPILTENGGRWSWMCDTPNLWDYFVENDDGFTAHSATSNGPFRCPYADGDQVGFIEQDRLWVKESWRPVERESDAVDGILFAADDAFVSIENTREAAERWVEVYDNGKHGSKWRSPLFMPRWASRITLEVTEIRAERLQEISEEDAIAEGMRRNVTRSHWCGVPHRAHGMPKQHNTAREAYADLWDQINKRRAAWSENRFVWVVTFRRIEQ